MMKLYSLGFFILLGLGFIGFTSSSFLERDYGINSSSIIEITPETTVWDALTALGKIRLHSLEAKDTLSNAALGKSLVFEGAAINPLTGKLSPRINTQFTCNACHNSEKEFSTLLDTSAQDRLAYARANNLPFLPANTFYGIVNRVYFFTGAFQSKYSIELDFKGAPTNLRKAINFCAQHISKGRPLERWETESILAYFWTLQLKVKDLNMPEEDKEKIDFALKEKVSTARAVNLIENKYKDRYTSTFATPMNYRSLDSHTANSEIRFENGKKIYELSCMHCHDNKRFSSTLLDYNKKTFQLMDKRLQQGHKLSIYKIIREGFETKKSCMPLYSIEKMNDEQIIDLRIYIQKMAN